ncbi:hypothetical protein WJX81_006097 [Elliptochloris bilobata]|uniref:Rho-GAP domain-containing protein n=1 Tax=Elliptochloris bilobata TaxID=381761 RepID=A0AAW1RXM5_9CHLO
MQRRSRVPLFGRSISDFSGQPALVRDILAKLRGSLCHSDLFMKPCSPRTREKIVLMRKAWDAGTCPLRLAGVQDADAIAGALTLWLECLPEPLIPQQLYWPLLHAVRETDAETRRSKIQMLLRQVGSTALLVLFPLLELLHHLVVNHAPAHLLGVRASFPPGAYGISPRTVVLGAAEAAEGGKPGAGAVGAPDLAAGGLAGGAPKRRLSDEGKAMLGKEETAALALALAESAACSDRPGSGGDSLRPLYVRYKRALRGQSAGPV